MGCNTLDFQLSTSFSFTLLIQFSSVHFSIWIIYSNFQVSTSHFYFSIPTFKFPLSSFTFLFRLSSFHLKFYFSIPTFKFPLLSFTFLFRLSSFHFQDLLLHFCFRRIFHGENFSAIIAHNVLRPCLRCGKTNWVLSAKIKFFRDEDVPVTKNQQLSLCAVISCF